MRIEDAELLATDPADVHRDLEFAEKRLADHERLERERVAAGLPTDMSRYLDGGEVRD